MQSCHTFCLCECSSHSAVVISCSCSYTVHLPSIHEFAKNAENPHRRSVHCIVFDCIMIFYSALWSVSVRNRLKTTQLSHWVAACVYSRLELKCIADVGEKQANKKNHWVWNSPVSFYLRSAFDCQDWQLKNKKTVISAITEWLRKPESWYASHWCCVCFYQEGWLITVRSLFTHFSALVSSVSDLVLTIIIHKDSRWNHV